MNPTVTVYHYRTMLHSAFQELRPFLNPFHLRTTSASTRNTRTSARLHAICIGNKNKKSTASAAAANEHNVYSVFSFCSTTNHTQCSQWGNKNVNKMVNHPPHPVVAELFRCNWRTRKCVWPFPRLLACLCPKTTVR